MMNRRVANADYYRRTRDRIILRESELRPSTILEIIDCLGSLGLHPGCEGKVAMSTLAKANAGIKWLERDTPKPIRRSRRFFAANGDCLCPGLIFLGDVASL